LPELTAQQLALTPFVRAMHIKSIPMCRLCQRLFEVSSKGAC
jgi:hypothetical protein